jgi:hypothetical protein
VNTVNNPKPSQKIPLIILLGVLLIGVPLTVVALQQTQIFQQFAWATRQSATAACSSEHGGAVITVQFTNTENDKAMDVVAKDMQSGKTVDLGTIEPKATKKGEIITESKELAKGVVEFTLKWSDGSSGTDKRSAAYDAVEECSDAPPFCPANPEINEGLCKWEPLEGASGYEIEVVEKGSGDVVKKELASQTASQSAFPMIPGKAYECKVSPINACNAKGATVKSPEKVCTVPTPTPTEPVCPAPPQKQGVCKWDALEGAEEYKVAVKDPESNQTIESGTVKAPKTEYKFTADPVKKYVCSVTPVGKCSEGPPTDSPPTSCTVPSPTPTTPVPTGVTPSPTPTTPPSPSPTPTTPPSPSPSPTVPPSPTMPKATPTPIVIVRIPPNVAPPTNPPVQQPPVQQPPAQQPPIGGGQPPVQQQQQQPVPPTATFAPEQPSPVPTIRPTGALENSLVLVGASIILLITGALVFFVI